MRIYDISAPSSVMSFRIHGANDLSVTHVPKVYPDTIPQIITVVTGHANLIVNLNGTVIDTSASTTGSAGIATFSVIADSVHDTLWVTVTGGGFRYRGYICVDAYTPPLPDTVELVMGFEDASRWRFIAGRGALANNTSNVTQGTASMQISGNVWQQIKSVNLNTTKINELSSIFKMDIFIGVKQPNIWWIGQTQLYVNCPSAGINNQFVGLAELTGLPRNVFSTVSFVLPANVMTALSGSHNDFSFSIALNTNPGSGPYFLDNMRF